MRPGACRYNISRLGKILTFSSRKDFGILSVIAPSLGDIFRNNSMQNGMLPVVLSLEECVELAKDAEAGLEIEVDLEKEEVRRTNGKPPMPFSIDPFRRHCLLNGLDDIALTMQRSQIIELFETKRSELWPWLDGLGYGKIPIVAVRQAKQTEW